MRAILAGGGTGGHVIPALAIAQEMRAGVNADVLFVGTAHGLEARLVPAAGFPLRCVQVGALKSVSLATRVKTLGELPKAIYVAARIVQEFRAEVVVGVGGYASGPAMMAAALTGIPTLAFEPNVVPGFANRVAAPMVSLAAVHFAETARYFRRALVTGVPVRQEFFRVPPLAGAAEDGPPTLLVFGGSQGAAAINRVVMEALPSLICEVPGVHVIHQTGQRDYNHAQAVYLQSGISAEVYPFIEEMPAAFGRADLILCRSGASTVAEITAAGRPVIFVPFPKATDDHQRRNAEVLAHAGAALLLPEPELTSQHLVATVAGLLRDRPRLLAMAQAARRLSHPDAAREIARMAARLARSSA
jgi:UDP-N-acetylglucosamine--N-acetylmuramyl-(pentapeptide) pyrophosphoryl-undecaprenol N-acetylglucosamine transferase